ncbi:hypothetical protein VTO73DRAFT_1578 [Trametes versicolor]
MWGRTNTPEPMVEAARAVVVARISVVGAQRRKPSRFGVHRRNDKHYHCTTLYQPTHDYHGRGLDKFMG